MPSKNNIRILKKEGKLKAKAQVLQSLLYRQRLLRVAGWLWSAIMGVVLQKTETDTCFSNFINI